MLCIWLNLLPKSINKDSLVSEFLETFSVVKEAEIKITRNAYINLRAQFKPLLPSGKHSSGYSSCLCLLTRNSVCEIEDWLQEYGHESMCINVAQPFFYITAEKKETETLKEILFNTNSLHFLKYGKPFKYSKAWNLCREFKETLEKTGENLNDYIIETSMVLAMYGVREANDLDYSTASDKEVHFSNDKIDKHSVYYQHFYDCPVSSLIKDSANYFVFNGLKFVSIDKLLQYKELRYKKEREYKDRVDVRLLTKLMQGGNTLSYDFLRIQLIAHHAWKKNINKIKDFVKSVLIRMKIYKC